MNDLFKKPYPLNLSGVLEFHRLNKACYGRVGVISHLHNIISRPPVDTNPDILFETVG